ncbi:hypothetical protein [Butyrivibrio fibrisolvens]|uniref:hypothetical protein n=1 Tax=Butyrivibrio fibrisolvens TaxID=831 RepID=UPI00040F9FB8|nr:hypothetical protein [Butyrivibrio fibrisolvens]
MANENKNATLDLEDVDVDSFDYDALEKELEEDLSDLQGLREDELKIGNPDALGDAVTAVIWDQFLNQVGAVAGEDFIKENHGKTLDLRDEAHILTAEGFEKGKLPEHNFENANKYEKRYEETRADFQTDPNMEVKMSKNMRFNEENKTYERFDSEKKEWVGKTRYNEETKTWEDYNPRNSKWEKKLASDAREKFDTRKSKEMGSKTVNKDHVISAAEQIRDKEAAAYMDRAERQDFAKSDVNIQDLDSAANQSKSDLSTEEWLNEKRKDGQGQAEYFGVDEEELRDNDKKARKEYEDKKKDAEKKVVDEGRKSQKAEAFRIGGKALRAAVMGLLAELGRTILQKLIAWLKAGAKNIKTFIQYVKEAISTFVTNIKQNILSAGSAVASTIVAAIFGPVAGMINRIIMFVKQGVRSLKEAVQYIKNPENRKKPFSVMMLEIGKIIIAGITAAGAIALGEVIEAGLTTIPGFGVEIPLIGSLANIIGIFLGAVVAGIAGALAIHVIDKIVSDKLKAENKKQQIEQANKALVKQGKQIIIAGKQIETVKSETAMSIKERHEVAAEEIRSSVEHIRSNKKVDNEETLRNINDMLDNL